ncbi:MAG: SdpI family protein [Saprospiraceae bacterium]
METVLPHLFIGPMMLLLSWIFSQYPPKEINQLYGYRTKRSMKNPATWKLANEYSMNLMTKWSAYLCLIQIGLYLILPARTAILTACVILVIGLIAILPLTEKQLKTHFDELGNPRHTPPSEQ